MCVKQTRKVISKRTENEWECVCEWVWVVRRPPMLMCSHQIFFRFLFFRFAIRLPVVVTGSNGDGFETFTLSDNTQFYTSTYIFFLSLTTHAHTQTQQIPHTYSYIIIQRIVSPGKRLQNQIFCFVPKAFFPCYCCQCLFFRAARLYWSLSLRCLTCILCERYTPLWIWIWMSRICMSIAHTAAAATTTRTNEPMNTLPCAIHLAWWSIIFLNGLFFDNVRQLRTDAGMSVWQLNAHRFSIQVGSHRVADNAVAAAATATVSLPQHQSKKRRKELNKLRKKGREREATKN